MASRIHSFSCILNHMCPRERTNFTALGSGLLFAHSIVPVLIIVQCWEVSAAGSVLFSSTVNMPALQKYAQSVCVAYMSKVQMFLQVFFFYQAKVNTEVRECHTIWLSVKHIKEL